MERERIPVDNSEFSTFSTVFSTGVIHRMAALWRRKKVHIKAWTGLWQISHFSAAVDFAHRKNFVKNLPLDKTEREGSGETEADRRG